MLLLCAARAPSPHSFISSREGYGRQLDLVNGRHGLPRGPFYSVHDFVEYVCRLPMLVRSRTLREVWASAEMLQPGNPGTRFVDHLAEFGFDWEGFKVHDHYCWSRYVPQEASCAAGRVHLLRMCRSVSLVCHGVR